MDLLIQIALFLLLGVLLYYVDSAVLTGLYRAFYNMTHRDPLDPSVRRGFLLNRNARVRLVWAGAITAIAAIFTLISGNFFNDTTRVVLNLLAMLVGLSGGMVLAPILIKTVPGKLEQAVDYADRKEEELKSAPGAGAGKAVITSPQEQSKQPDSGGQDVSSGKAAFPNPERPSGTASGSSGQHQADASGSTRTIGDEPDLPAGGKDQPKDWRKGVDEFLKK